MVQLTVPIPTSIHHPSPPPTFKLAWFWKAPSTSVSTSTSTSPLLPSKHQSPPSTQTQAHQPLTQRSGLIMSQPYPPPSPLTPAFCFSERALADFLRLSRSAIDDTISTSLNALLTPSSTSPFTPTSTSSISSPRPTPIPPISCQAFTQSVLFPSWQTRSDVLTYCASVATSPDPDD